MGFPRKEREGKQSLTRRGSYILKAKKKLFLLNFGLILDVKQEDYWGVPSLGLNTNSFPNDLWVLIYGVNRTFSDVVERRSGDVEAERFEQRKEWF